MNFVAFALISVDPGPEPVEPTYETFIGTGGTLYQVRSINATQEQVRMMSSTDPDYPISSWFTHMKPSVARSHA